MAGEPQERRKMFGGLEGRRIRLGTGREEEEGWWLEGWRRRVGKRRGVRRLGVGAGEQKKGWDWKQEGGRLDGRRRVEVGRNKGEGWGPE